MSQNATGLSFYKHSFPGSCQAGCEYRGDRTLLLKACPQQWEIFDSHFMPAAPHISSFFAAASSFLGGPLVSHVLYIPSSMLKVGHVHQLGAQSLWPWTPYLGRGAAGAAVPSSAGGRVTSAIISVLAEIPM